MHAMIMSGMSNREKAPKSPTLAGTLIGERPKLDIADRRFAAARRQIANDALYALSTYMTLIVRRHALPIATPPIE